MRRFNPPCALMMTVSEQEVAERLMTAIRKGRLMIARVAPYIIVWMVNVALILVLGALLFGLLFLKLYAS